MKKKTIVVTGGAGFIGLNLVQSLAKENFEVVVFNKKDVPAYAKDALKKIKLLELDLLEEDKLKNALRSINPSILVHLAANNNPDRNPKNIKELMKDNFDTTLSIYTAALELKNLECIITLGSAGEYEGNEVPFVETQKELPASPYSFSKTCAGNLSSYFFRVHGLPIITLRPFVVYGECQTSNMFIPSVIRKCLQNEIVDMTPGEQSKDFVYVKDLVNAIISCINTKDKKSLLGEVINICTGEEVMLKDAVLLIKKETSSSLQINFGALKYRENENMHFYGSNEKARQLLNWSPQYSFEEGIKNTVKWYREYLTK